MFCKWVALGGGRGVWGQYEYLVVSLVRLGPVQTVLGWFGLGAVGDYCWGDEVTEYSTGLG